MKRPDHRTSRALDTWSAILLFIGIACIGYAVFSQDVSYASTGVICIIARPLFRSLSVLVRSAERNLFENGDPAFTRGQDDPEENDAAQA